MLCRASPLDELVQAKIGCVPEVDIETIGGCFFGRTLVEQLRNKQKIAVFRGYH